MDRFIYLLLLLFGLLMLGCKTEEQASNPGKITAWTYKVSSSDLEPDEETETYNEKMKNITTVRLCHDTDNGIVRWINGSIFGFYGNATRFEFSDYCQNFNYLMEFYCENEYPKQKLFLCRNGCVDAHCN